MAVKRLYDNIKYGKKSLCVTGVSPFIYVKYSEMLVILSRQYPGDDIFSYGSDIKIAGV